MFNDASSALYEARSFINHAGVPPVVKTLPSQCLSFASKRAICSSVSSSFFCLKNRMISDNIFMELSLLGIVRRLVDFPYAGYLDGITALVLGEQAGAMDFLPNGYPAIPTVS